MTDRENGASINYRANFIWSLTNTLKRYMEADPENKKSVLDRQTIQGIKWAIDFMKSLDHEYMTEKELKHTIRLTYFRGRTCPTYTA